MSKSDWLFVCVAEFVEVETPTLFRRTPGVSVDMSAVCALLVFSFFVPQLELWYLHISEIFVYVTVLPSYSW